MKLIFVALAMLVPLWATDPRIAILTTQLAARETRLKEMDAQAVVYRADLEHARQQLAGTAAKLAAAQAAENGLRAANAELMKQNVVLARQLSAATETIRQSVDRAGNKIAESADIGAQNQALLRELERALVVVSIAFFMLGLLMFGTLSWLLARYMNYQTERRNRELVEQLEQVRFDQKFMQETLTDLVGGKKEASLPPPPLRR